MIPEEKEPVALLAIRAIVCEAQALARAGAPHQRIAELLDWAEYLPGMMLEEEDKTTFFRSVLAELAGEFQSFEEVLREFDGEMGSNEG